MISYNICLWLLHLVWQSLDPSILLCACVLSCFSCVWLFVTLWTPAYQASLVKKFSREEYWSGLPCPRPGDLPDPGIEPVSLRSPAVAGGFFTTSAIWKAPTCNDGMMQSPTVTIWDKSSIKQCFIWNRFSMCVSYYFSSAWWILFLGCRVYQCSQLTCLLSTYYGPVQDAWDISLNRTPQIPALVELLQVEDRE